ncbi:hypothetical protein E0493_06430 [Roseomonas sp. M0104]|uniref:Uncharacterized protein n=1 Tax=Teichococcus coralli TaxID=2545983 RepID=A0A845B8V9_9PROT|nr:hypothetical protein [Pseudoroseomonas coralli]MXP62988.1 hypothetical protein [Pseudoroseomonas coralli]
MTATDNLRVLRQQAYAARRTHIAGTLGKTHDSSARARLPGLQRMIAGLDEALELNGRNGAEARRDNRS